MSYITKETMEQQIFEMWDAINQIPAHNCDRDYAINQAQEIENTARKRYRKQEQLKDSAPELLKRLKAALYLVRIFYGNLDKEVNVFIKETQELINDIEK